MRKSIDELADNFVSTRENFRLAQDKLFNTFKVSRKLEKAIGQLLRLKQESERAINEVLMSGYSLDTALKVGLRNLETKEKA